MSQWTEAQERAITARGTNLLVSAGAGAGKTAVLVERIIGRILDPHEPIDVDRLLVVTFTNAAAAEMRERIGAALFSRLKEDPTNDYLLKQVALLGKASITTLHSFCLELMRLYFYQLGLDPSFRVADETETDLIKADVLESLLEEHYLELDDAFCSLVEGFGGRNDDQGLQQLILRIADYALSQAKPHEWLSRASQSMDISTGSFEHLPWYNEVVADIAQAVDAACDSLQKARSIAFKPAGPKHYAKVLDDDLDALSSIASAQNSSWNELRNAVMKVEFSRLPSKKEGDKDLRELAKAQRDKAKKIMSTIQKSYTGQSEEQVVKALGASAPQVQKLCSLVEDYLGHYAQTKLGKGLVDFADLEHMALKLLDGGDSPSIVANELRQKYAEVLVDEYQDINGVQERILSLVSRSCNRFMVGDIKQSIYGFRLAEPKVFRSKEQDYLLKPDLGECIHLSHNFRSRPAVLSAVNYIFKQLMSQAVGGVEYNHAAELRAGAEYLPNLSAVTPEVEIAILDRRFIDEEDEEHEEELSVTEREARLIAKKVQELVQSRRTSIYDKATKSFRPVQYKDIVVLLRATSGRVETFMDAFNHYGVPAYADTNSGYFSAVEIMNMLNLLKIIDNPRQDIPLTGVLRSPLVSLSGAELAQIRTLGLHGDYWDAVMTASRGDDTLGAKLKRFLDQLTRWRKLARRGALPDLLWQIYEDTGYYLYVGALPRGAARQANLRALYNRACQYESTSFRGVFRFLRFIERIQEHNGDLGTAKTLGENEDVVRIMSIHKSKGLEFPIVFVAGLGNKFNHADLNQPVLIHREYGLGPQVVDLTSRCLYPTLPRLAIKRRLLADSLSEELRVLYVALTRAREKLYLVGSINKREESISAWLQLASDHRETLLPSSILGAARSYLDWIGPACYRHVGLNPQSVFRDNGGALFALLKQQDELEQGVADVAQTAAELDSVAALLPLDDYGYRELLHNRFSWAYPAQQATVAPVKITVSELKRKLAIEADADAVPYLSLAPRRPSFVRQKQGLTPAEIGTAMHMLMQHIDLASSVTRDTLLKLKADLLHRNLLSEDEAEVIDLEKIIGFFNSDIGRRMQNSPQVWRELPFSLRMPAKEIHPDVEDEHVYIQGVIDCLFREGDSVVLVDFKNDHVPAGGIASVAERYKVQIEMYSRAIRELLKREVKEAYLYLFSAGAIRMS